MLNPIGKSDPPPSVDAVDAVCYQCGRPQRAAKDNSSICWVCGSIIEVTGALPDAWGIVGKSVHQGATVVVHPPESESDRRSRKLTASLDLDAAANTLVPFIEHTKYLVASGKPKMRDGRDFLAHCGRKEFCFMAHETAKIIFRKHVYLFPQYEDQWSTLSEAEVGSLEESILLLVLEEKHRLLKQASAAARAQAYLGDSSKIIPTTIYHHHGDLIMRDQYRDFVGAAVGPNSTATNATVQVWRSAAAGLDLKGLAAALSRLRPKLKAADPDGEHDEEIGRVASAEKSAYKEDGEGALQHLKETGLWILKVARSVGETVAADAIESALRLPKNS